MLNLLGKGEQNFTFNGTGHMTKMAAMPIYGKNLVCPCPGAKYMYMAIILQGQIWQFRLFYRKMGKQWIFQKLLQPVA